MQILALDRKNFALEEAYIYNMKQKDKREAKKIIFEYFDYIEKEWDRFQKKKSR